MATMIQSPVRVTRKSLADQIDRLDTILDGLSDALNESVADAVRGVVGTAVRQAVQLSLQEVLDNPELLRLALLKHGLDATPLGSPSPMSFGQRVAGLLQRAGESIRQAACSVGEKLQRLGSWTLHQIRHSRATSLALLHRIRQASTTALYTMGRVSHGAGRKLNALGRLLWRHPVLTTLTLAAGAVGVALGILGPREMTATLLGLSTSLVTLGGSLLTRFRNLIRHLPLSV